MAQLPHQHRGGCDVCVWVLAQDERSYKPDVFATIPDILDRRAVRGKAEQRKYREFLEAVAALKGEDDDIEGDDVDIPPQFLEATAACLDAAHPTGCFSLGGGASPPLPFSSHFMAPADSVLQTLMRDPVRLPSGNPVDRNTATQLLLNDRLDPFTRKPLTEEAITPDAALRAEIAEWIAQRRASRASAPRQ
ncbi:putative ubiquitin conjugation factor E4 A [Paratrimastix pyriformis]|uniref:Ubiquitin conjugation factor E4 A n=1 Tax=Paratrimastix pyriformis TaxID=342808 RepID=A0ABQ8UP37_9EUKA|nr:putative ubiquitin conjugation factor E4 A [Paratrimastix pyriformis]